MDFPLITKYPGAVYQGTFKQKRDLVDKASFLLILMVQRADHHRLALILSAQDNE